MSTKIDLERCRRGMRQLDVEGVPREGLIEDAIAAIQKDPVAALKVRYFGIKNYASFGDQREDHEYGYGPKHGTIVFRIARSNDMRGGEKALNADAIYYLEAYRDFGFLEWRDARENRYFRIGLGRAIHELDSLDAQRRVVLDAFAKTEVETHAAATA